MTAKTDKQKIKELNAMLKHRDLFQMNDEQAEKIRSIRDNLKQNRKKIKLK